MKIPSKFTEAHQMPFDKPNSLKPEQDDANFSEGLYQMRVIGEILIVIIGIFFAIQIYHWNENKKQSNDIYEFFKKELKIDFGYIDNFPPN